MSERVVTDRTLLENLRIARNAALEEAASVVDQCNREGPYNAIGAASRIRALKIAALGGGQ